MAELRERVEAVISTIRPMLQADGGDVELVEVGADGVVKVKLKGACGGCPMSRITLKRGIEARVKKEIPEIVSVEAV
jgi:Fe-S cluster biogenesis protein NfuA